MALRLVVRLTDEDGHKLQLGLRAGAIDLLDQDGNPLLTTDRRQSNLGALSGGAHPCSPRVFLPSSAGHWTAFRDTFNLPDDRSLDDWYREVHQALNNYVHRATNTNGLYHVLRSIMAKMGLRISR